MHVADRGLRRDNAKALKCVFSASERIIESLP
jgi:hypothetical protein